MVQIEYLVSKGALVSYRYKDDRYEPVARGLDNRLTNSVYDHLYNVLCDVEGMSTDILKLIQSYWTMVVDGVVL